MDRCKPKILKIDADWRIVKNACRTTVNKEGTDIIPTPSFKYSLLISEHSPIRLITVMWRWDKMKSWVTVHFARHWLGWEKWIGTRRSDRIHQDRNELRQDELIPMEVCASAQALITVSRTRLCFQASPETRMHMEDVKEVLHLEQPELSDVMVPNCVYRGLCPETFAECAFWKKLCEGMTKEEIIHWQSRYAHYNKQFWKGRKTNVECL